MVRKQVMEAVTTAPTEALHIKYRPSKLSQVIGQKAVVKSLETALKAKARAHCFMFTGPGGTGKTTLARIIASEFGCDPANMIEVDAASNSGIDDMRGVTAALRYNGFGENPAKAIIIDECQGLSKQAWDSLLKSTEDTPPHVYFFFCSTNPAKIPQTMVTRSLAYTLNPVKHDDLMDLLEDVCKAEDYDTPDSILNKVARACEGSPRQALTMLAAVHAADEDDADILLQMPMESKEVIDLCRLLVRRELSWPKLVATLKAIPDTPAESVRIVVSNYLASCAMGARSDRDAQELIDMMALFGKPFTSSDKLAPLLVAFGRCIFD